MNSVTFNMNNLNSTKYPTSSRSLDKTTLQTMTLQQQQQQQQQAQKRTMVAVVPKYAPMLYILIFLLIVDFVINSFSELLKTQIITMLVLYIIQDFCILFSSLLILIMLINTYMFQAGLMGYMIGKFKSLWILTVFYLALCFALQIWLMIVRWSNPLTFIWSDGLVVIYVFQRTFSVLYYYIYKRTAYRLSDPRFYEDSEWLRKEFEKRQ